MPSVTEQLQSPDQIVDQTTKPSKTTVSSFGGQVLLTTIINAALGAIGLGTGVLSARMLGVEGRGILAAIQTWPLCIALVAMVGLPEALVFFSARDRSQSRRYLSSALIFALLASAVFMAIGYSLLPALLAKQPLVVVNSAQMFLLVIPLNTIVVLSLFALRGCNDVLTWNALRLAPAVGWAMVLGVALFLNHCDPVYLAKGYLILMCVLAVLVLSVSLRRLSGTFAPDVSRTKRMLVFGLPSLATSLPLILNMRLDQLFITGFLAPSALGVYVVAVAWGTMTYPLLYALGTILFPKVAAIENEALRLEAFAQGTRVAVVLCGCLAVLVAFPGLILVPLVFGAQFQSAGPLAFLLTFAAIVAGFNLILEEGLRGLGFPVAVMWAELAGLAATGGLLLLFLKPFGLMGAAFASFFGYQVITLLLMLQIKARSHSPVSRFLFPTAMDLRSIKQQAERLLPLLFRKAGLTTRKRFA